MKTFYGIKQIHLTPAILKQENHPSITTLMKSRDERKS